MPGTGAAWPVDLAPVCAVNTAPPFAADNALGCPNSRRDIGPEDKGPTPALGLADMTSCIDKGGELGICDTGRANQERCHPNPSHRAFTIISKFVSVSSDKGPTTGDWHSMIRRQTLTGSGSRRDNPIGPVGRRRAAAVSRVCHWGNSLVLAVVSQRIKSYLLPEEQNIGGQASRLLSGASHHR